ncbi:hypothetical protein MRX96_025058 [Rhipicephalus microplus]
MKNGDESLFYTFYRMSPATFDVLHSLVKEELTRDQCPSREPISSGERLALTLRYLSLGMLVRDAAMAFRVGIETARNIIHETCAVLWEVLAPEYMKMDGHEDQEYAGPPPTPDAGARGRQFMFDTMAVDRLPAQGSSGGHARERERTATRSSNSSQPRLNMSVIPTHHHYHHYLTAV